MGTVTSYAQFSGINDMESPVKWEGSVEKTGDNSYDLIFNAEIDEGWHI